MAKQDDYTRYTIRIPTPLYEQLKESSGEKSVNAEILERLQSSIEAVDGGNSILDVGMIRAIRNKYHDKKLGEFSLDDLIADLKTMAEGFYEAKNAFDNTKEFIACYDEVYGPLYKEVKERLEGMKIDMASQPSGFASFKGNNEDNS